MNQPNILRALNDGALLIVSLERGGYLALVAFGTAKPFEGRGETLDAALETVNFALLLHYNERDLKEAGSN